MEQFSRLFFSSLKQGFFSRNLWTSALNCEDRKGLRLNWDNNFTILGFDIDNKLQDIDSNFEPIHVKQKSLINDWISQNLPIQGKINISKCMLVSQYTYFVFIEIYSAYTCLSVPMYPRVFLFRYTYKYMFIFLHMYLHIAPHIHLYYPSLQEYACIYVYYTYMAVYVYKCLYVLMHV